MKKDNIRNKIAVVITCYIIASGNILFFLLIDHLIGIKETAGLALMIIFFWAWIGLLMHIEKKYFNGLYESWKNDPNTPK